MSFLKKIGLAIAKGAEYVAVAQGFIQKLPGRVEAVVENELAKLLDVIVQVEAMGATLTLSGAQKLAAAIPRIRQVVLGFLQATGHEVSDAALFDKAMAGLTQALADMANSLKPKA